MIEHSAHTINRTHIVDLVLKNANIINVFTHEIEIADVAIRDGIIIGIGQYDGVDQIDCTGKYICPGFIDGHIHIESSMVTPSEFERAILPHGTTAIVTDPHEIVNVAGCDGLDYMLALTENLQMDIFFMLPSCVPSTTLDRKSVV